MKSRLYLFIFLVAILAMVVALQILPQEASDKRPLKMQKQLAGSPRPGD